MEVSQLKSIIFSLCALHFDRYFTDRPSRNLALSLLTKTYLLAFYSFEVLSCLML